MISAERLTRRYGEVVAASNVSFDVGAGEIVGLLGHNGAGKTTIMKILTGFLEPSAGSATIDGIDVQENPAMAQAQLGYLPENLPLYPEMTVVDYLMFAARMRHVGESECGPAVKRAMDATNLRSRALDAIGTLSRGYRQRVGVAQAILHEPQGLILDEPSNGLDPGQTQHMRELIKQLSRTATVILSTHIMQEVSAICDRVLIMRGGELVVDEKLEDLQSSNRIELKSSASLDDVQRAVSDRAEAAAENDRFVLTTTGAGGDAQIADLAHALVNGGVPIHSLAPERRDLEALFREVSEVSDAA